MKCPFSLFVVCFILNTYHLLLLLVLVVVVLALQHLWLLFFSFHPIQRCYACSLSHLIHVRMLMLYTTHLYTIYITVVYIRSVYIPKDSIAFRWWDRCMTTFIRIHRKTHTHTQISTNSYIWRVCLNIWLKCTCADTSAFVLSFKRSFVLFACSNFLYHSPCSCPHMCLGRSLVLPCFYIVTVELLVGSVYINICRCISACVCIFVCLNTISPPIEFDYDRFGSFRDIFCAFDSLENFIHKLQHATKPKIRSTHKATDFIHLPSAFSHICTTF